MQYDAPSPRREGTRCPQPCGKRRYYTRKQARQAANRYKQQRHVYQCDWYPGFWHLTSQSALRITAWREYRAKTGSGRKVLWPQIEQDTEEN